jgi:polar amino acid transport system substrate-binding protein
MKIQKKRSAILVLLLAVVLVFAFAACSKAPAGSSAAAGGSSASADSSASSADGPAVSDAAALETLTPGKLTIATGNPAWAPWVLNDDPESGEGFEAAVAYAVAGQLGFAKEDVVWVRTDFDAAVQPGPKDFDFNLQQYSVTAERKEIVDFSSPYYKEPLVVVAKQDNEFAGATSIADLKGALFGAASGDIAIQFTTDAIAPDQEVQIYNNLSDVFAALNSGQIDAALVGLLTGDYVINIEGEQVENGTIIGKVAGSEDATEGLGLLLPKDSPLTAAVTKAIDTLRSNGTLDELSSKWLSQYDIPELK